MFKRIIVGQLPFGHDRTAAHWTGVGLWRAMWIALPGTRGKARTVGYRNSFVLDAAATFHIAVSADAVYRLYVDGVWVANGPEAGDVAHTFVDSFVWKAAAGRHTFVALVSSFGDSGPYARMEFRHGFLLAATGEEGAKLETNSRNWQACPVPGHRWRDTLGGAGSIGQELVFDASGYPDGLESGQGGVFRKVTELYPGGDAETRNEFVPQPLLYPATLPEMDSGRVREFQVRYAGANRGRIFSGADNCEEERKGVESALKRGILTIPARSRRKYLLELDDYYCICPELVVSGGKGAKLSLGWAEALMLEDHPDGGKGDRRQWKERYFHGIYDHFRPDGRAGMHFYTLWYRAGRFLAIEVQTADEPLRVDELILKEFRYPVAGESRFAVNDPQLERIAALSFRTLEMCSHDTFMDCPYYEQLMYLGDTRIQALVTLASGRDDRLVRKALRMFSASQLESGIFQSRYPSRITQVIPTFSPFFIGMLEDYARWRGGELVRELLPAARRAVDAFERWINADGLVEIPRSWNFVDWTGWKDGVPPEGEYGVSGIINNLFLYGISSLANLYELTGDAALADYYRERAAAFAAKVIGAFWREESGLFADTRDGRSFSEHAQILALLSGALPPAVEAACGKSLCEHEDLTPATVYFCFYLFEVYRKFDCPELLEKRLQLFREMESYGLATLLERPEPSRSDCHAWSAHVLYHFYATMLGVRPLGLGFAGVEVRPMLIPGRKVSGRVAHPGGGFIEVEAELHCAVIKLPEALSGVFISPTGRSFELTAGENHLTF